MATPRTCRFCGETNLHWEWQGGIPVLVAQDGTLHHKVENKGSRNMPTVTGCVGEVAGTNG